MNNTEAVVLCRYVRAVCPQQAIDEFTPDAWADLLCDVRMADAKDAVRAIAARQPFVAPAEIITEVRRIRNDRIIRHPEPVPPPDLTAIETQRWLLEARRQIGDGDIVLDTTRGELVARDTRALIAASTPKSIQEASL